MKYWTQSVGALEWKKMSIYQQSQLDSYLLVGSSARNLPRKDVEGLGGGGRGIGVGY